jgi:Domain of unknown function (DUF1905)
MAETHTLTTELWLWTSDKAPASWHFLSIKGDIANEIKAQAVMARLEMGLAKKRGWGSVKVEATIGETVWQTSIFPGNGDDTYLLPVKAAVRKAEGIVVGDQVTVTLELI